MSPDHGESAANHKTQAQFFRPTKRSYRSARLVHIEIYLPTLSPVKWEYFPTVPTIRSFVRLLRFLMKNFLLLLAALSSLTLLGCGHTTPATAAFENAKTSPPATADAASTNSDSVEAAPIQSADSTQGDSPMAQTPAPSQPATEPEEFVAQESSKSVPAPAGVRPPADRTPRRPGEAEKVTWEELNLGMQADVVFREFMLEGNDRVQELDGQRISIVGYMHGGQTTQRGIKEFILLKNTQCKFGPGGQADHLANVVMREGFTTSFTPSPIKVEGTLKIEPFQGPDMNTWYIYRLESAQIR